MGAESSCTISVSLTVPGGAGLGSHTNTTGAVGGTVDGMGLTGNVASDKLFVDPAPRVTKTFLDNPVGAGGTTRLEFTITNTSQTSGATGITFSDEFDSVLPTAFLEPADGSACGPSDFTFTPLFNPAPPSSPTPARLTLTGGALSAGQFCTFQITLNVLTSAAPGSYPNTTSAISATVDGATRTGDPASASLTVVAAPSLLKEFTTDPAQPGGTTILQFTLTNNDVTNTASAVGFTDDLTTAFAGLSAVPPLSTGTCNGSLSGTTTLTYSGGSLAAGASCTFSVTLSVPGSATPGSHTNTTSTVSATVSGVAAGSGAATADLVVAGLSLTKAFTDDPVQPGGTVTLRFTLTNASATGATGIFFQDNLGGSVGTGGTLTDLKGTGLPLNNACDPDGAGGAPGTGTLVGSLGDEFLTFIGGSVAANSSCFFDVTLLVPAGAADGSYTNTTGNVVSSFGAGDPATDTLTVNSNLLQITKAFTDDPVAPGGTVTLQFTLTNLDPANAASAIAFSDNLDAALTGLVATGATSNTCGGMATSMFPTGLFSYAGGGLAGGASCTITLTLTVPGMASPDTFTNTTSGVTGTILTLDVTGDPGSDDLRVRNLTFTKAFDGPTVAGGTPKLTFTITNLDASNAVSDLAFSDNLSNVIAGLEATSLPATPCGAGSALAGTGLLTFSGGTLLASDSCMFEVDLAVPGAAPAGTFPNTTTDLFKIGLPGLPLADPATASLTVEPAPTFTKSFAPDSITLAGKSRLTFTIANTAPSFAASSLDFTDSLPAGMVVATPPGTTNTCGGTPTAVAGASTISLTGGLVAAAATCTIAVDVTGTAGGVLVNTTGALTSSSGNSGTAADTLTVRLLTLTKEFTDDPVVPGGTVTLKFTLSNLDPALPATGIAFTDDLAAALAGLVAVGLPLTNLCGGVDGSSLTGTGVLTLTLPSLPAVTSCMFSVTLQVPAGAALGAHTNTTSTVTGTIGGARAAVVGVPATDDLRVANTIAPFVYTDASLTGVVVKVDHFAELRTHIGTARTAFGLGVFVFTDDPLVADMTEVKGIHLTDLRNAFDPVLVLAGIAAPGWLTVPATVTGLVIAAADLTQIRTLLDMLTTPP